MKCVECKHWEWEVTAPAAKWGICHKLLDSQDFDIDIDEDYLLSFPPDIEITTTEDFFCKEFEKGDEKDGQYLLFH